MHSLCREPGSQAAPPWNYGDRCDTSREGYRVFPGVKERETTQGNATPLPHILYSAASECGSANHLRICFSVFGLVLGEVMRRWVSQTSVQKASSSAAGSAVSRSLHHQSGKPCNLAHSVGVRRRTVYPESTAPGPFATCVGASSSSMQGLNCAFLP